MSNNEIGRVSITEHIDSFFASNFILTCFHVLNLLFMNYSFFFREHVKIYSDRLIAIPSFFYFAILLFLSELPAWPGAWQAPGGLPGQAPVQAKFFNF
jgi:hypothetical protein